MKCFYDFDKIKTCLMCKTEINICSECDNSCGSFECKNCKKELFAQHTNNMSIIEINKCMKLKHEIIEISQGFIIVCEGHNPECGEFD